METIREDKSCYRSAAQREVLMDLAGYPDLGNHFFLTGGTCLSVFYLHHRVSEDLDLFTRRPIPLSEIGVWIKRRWPKETTPVRETNEFLSLLIRNVRVDLVIDPVSLDQDRPLFTFENQTSLLIDTIDNIASNKMCAVISRTEPKDYVDLYLLSKEFPNFCLDTVYQQSRLKDAIFDDPPTAAFQLEYGVSFIKENPSLLPKVGGMNLSDFFGFYEKVANWLYGRVRK